MAPAKSMVRPPRTTEFGAPMSIIMRGSMSVLSLSLSMMILDEDHEVVAVVSTMLLGGSVEGKMW